VTAITISSVTKHFPKSGRIDLVGLVRGLSPAQRFTALSDVSLRVPKGEVVGVLGRNGAGKSTLLRLVGGIYSPDEGAVTLGGDVAGLFELGGFGNTQLTGREFAHRYLQLFGIGASERAGVVPEIHEFSELGDYFDERIRTYSAGMAARLYFAAATAIPHEIYLIDEILSVGDEHFQTKSWARMRERLAGGASGLLVTHDWSAVIRLCRQSCVLAAGRVAHAGRSDVVVASYLDLPAPSADRARFLAPEAAALFGQSGQSGQDCTILIDVQIDAKIEVQVALSLEALQLGVGWEPVLLTEYADVGAGPGRFTLAVHFPALPLAPGDYSLALFLATSPRGEGMQREILDARSWTYGNGLTFTVSGAPTPGVAPFPVIWQEDA
jgi:lipopolysaccharide transport system ATP-binding protein